MHSQREFALGSRQSPDDEFDAGDHDQGRGGGDEGLDVFSETPVAIELGEGALDHPAAGQQHETLGGIGTPDDLDRPPAKNSERCRERLACIAAIGEEVAEPWIQRAQRSDDADGAVGPVLNIGGVHLHAQQMALGVGHDSRLRPLTLLPASKPRGPPASQVLTDWLSIAPAVGLASRPMVSRACITSS